MKIKNLKTMQVQELKREEENHHDAAKVVLSQEKKCQGLW